MKAPLNLLVEKLTELRDMSTDNVVKATYQIAITEVKETEKMKKANQFTRVGTFCEKCRQVICICKPEINPPMQKKLIIDQLIEEYQKELDETYEKEGKDFYSHKALSVKRKQLRIFITRLQSLRQQEVQNVIDAVSSTVSLYVDPRCSDKYIQSKGNDYFNQTFKQEGGIVK